MKTYAMEQVRSAVSSGSVLSANICLLDERELDRTALPDKSNALGTVPEMAGLKHVLYERITVAAAQGAIWHDAEDVFAELEAGNAD